MDKALFFILGTNQSGTWQIDAEGGGFCNIVATTMRGSRQEGFLGVFLDEIEVRAALLGRRGQAREGHSRR